MYKFETMQVHAGQEIPDPTTDSRAVPIYQTAAYVFKDTATAAGRFALTEPGNIYTRLMNPTSDVFEKRMTALEGGVGALATASGMSAIHYAIQNIAKTGDHIVSDLCLYGGTYVLFNSIFPEMGIDVSFAHGAPENFEAAIKPNTKAIFVESIGNPNSTIVDIEAIAKVAHKHGIPLIVDNTFATPYLLRPKDYGADIVVHSATKFICGHGTSIGGVLIDLGTFDWAQNDKFPGLSQPNPCYHGAVFTEVAGKLAYIVKARTILMRDLGAVPAPFNTFLFLQGLETLSLRVERHVFNALKVVDYLSKHPKIDKVNHPSIPNHPHNALYKKYYPNGAGSVFTFEINGDIESAKRFIEKVELISHMTNLADVKSMVIHPASTTHSQLTAEELKASFITETTIRLSVGTEHIDDIITDLEQALAVV